ncbi:hypothetical protein ACN38_g8048 [Penicillium nordicum]|uniref:Uncharacterized protein n=1 Tax=Penicillium nordicum TaxID=229535 RepID=A0A0M9WDY6_9EURO|nr:hypothetical protein ACN38_g8048 [Penicillium nordicum]
MRRLHPKLTIIQVMCFFSNYPDRTKYLLIYGGLRHLQRREVGAYGDCIQGNHYGKDGMVIKDSEFLIDRSAHGPRSSDTLPPNYARDVS